MRRRELLAFAGAALAWTKDSSAQSAPPKVVGFLGNVRARDWQRFVEAFRKGLADNGFVDGNNVRIVFRWSDGDNSKLPALAAELIALRPDVISVIGDPGSKAAKQLTGSIPIVAIGGFDPIKQGLVESINRPGGNVTGVFSLNSEIAPKRLQMLQEALPGAKKIGVLIRPSNLSNREEIDALLAAGLKLGIDVPTLEADDETQLPAIFGRIAKERIEALIVSTDTLLFSLSSRIAQLALDHKLPAISPLRAFALTGGLISYGADIVAMNHQQATYVARILKGDRPRDLPVVLASRFETLINLKAAKALGLELPPSLLLRADEVIE